MSLTESTTGIGGILPEEYGDLIIEPVTRVAAALNPLIATRIDTAAHELHVPIVDTDAAASWVSEGAEITPTDPTLSELTITPAKVAALVVVSSELADDSNPAAASLVGSGIARAVAAQLDTAFFGDVASPAPAGLGSLDESTSGITVVDASAADLADLDPFAEALVAVEKAGATATAFAMNPDDWQTVLTLKTTSTSNQPLLGSDASAASARSVFGVPVVLTPKLAQGTVWALAADRVLVVMRDDVSVESSGSPYFTSDRIAVRATMRASFGFPHPAALAKIKLKTT